MRFKLTLLSLFVSIAQIFAQVDLDVNVYEARSNAVKSGVQVTLSNGAIGFKAEKTTDAQGKAVFYGLSTSGAYKVDIAETPEYYSAEKTEISLRSNTNASVTIPLFKKQDVALDEIEVRGATKINTRNAEVSSELRQKEIENLPVEGRDITRALFR
ncbi:MAG: carboxypeptidase-like regulatory domain-containing protein, partial [Bacteroidota bacterium]